MATLTIRNLADDLHAALRVRAAKARRSMEEEVRVLLAEAVSRDDAEEARRADIAKRVAEAQAIVREMFGGELPKGRVDEFIAERRAAAERDE